MLSRICQENGVLFHTDATQMPWKRKTSPGRAKSRGKSTRSWGRISGMKKNTFIPR